MGRRSLGGSARTRCGGGLRAGVRRRGIRCAVAPRHRFRRTAHAAAGRFGRGGGWFGGVLVAGSRWWPGGAGGGR
ncbi:hypothetical protein DMP23_46145 [Amycolatopsis sp. A1MSW2902]